MMRSLSVMGSGAMQLATRSVMAMGIVILVTPWPSYSQEPAAPELIKDANPTGDSQDGSLVSSSAKEKTSTPLEALDLFYAGLGVRDNEEPGSDSEGEIPRVKGIRYSFIRETGFHEEKELGESTKISGDWRDVRLTIEPNESGYLYVLVPVGRDNWQQLKGKKRKNRRGKQDPAYVKAFQTVQFGLSSVTNMLGKLVVSSISVVLSPIPMADPGQKLADQTNLSGNMTEHVDDSVFVVQPESAPNKPFLMKISL